MFNSKSRVRWVIILMVGLVLSGCSGFTSSTGSTTAEDGIVELKFLHKWPQPEFSPYFDEVIKEFEKQHPHIRIAVEAVADEPIKDKLRVVMGGGAVPDITFSWSGEFARKFVRSGVAMDLTEYLDADPEWRERFIPASLQSFSLEGRNYGIPLRFNGKFFVYHKEVFERYHLEKPTTWAEFIHVLETLKAAGETPIVLGNSSSWAAIHYLTGFNQMLVDEDVITKDYHPSSGEFTDPGYVAALRYLKEFQDQGYFNSNVNSSSHDMATQLFFSGQGAMMYLELEEFQTVEQMIPGKWDFFQMPDLADGKGHQSFVTGAPDGFIVSAQTKHPKEVMTFLKFLTSQENAGKMVNQLGWPSPIDGATNPTNTLKQVAEGVEVIKGAERMAEWLDTDVHARVADVYLTNIQLLLDGTKSPEEIMQEVQKVAKEVQQEVD
ncbi:ABC transporter substrate-binding protein [Caldalkalibacillus mannanilyticus]|uniref:ABC transporter substrate-binding protein n=1 Tax=Caldalkalibacillus mannanilyticus TaxID=1418 RepID=UPI000468EAD9|nr:extracellular solute-binding protein [Caldalkalibacillus mannanilyticus]